MPPCPTKGLWEHKIRWQKLGQSYGFQTQSSPHSSEEKKKKKGVRSPHSQVSSHIA